jgi:hypothetical protein
VHRFRSILDQSHAGEGVERPIAYVAGEALTAVGALDELTILEEPSGDQITEWGSKQRCAIKTVVRGSQHHWAICRSRAGRKID